MAELSIKVTDFIPDFIRILQSQNPGVAFNHTEKALDHAALMVQEVWRKYASGRMQVPGAKMIHSRGPYTRSIQIHKPQKGIREVYTDYGPHRYIEQGHGEIDLKPGLLSGPSAKMGKKGPYNIVSFRHGTPRADKFRSNPMPVRVYATVLRESKRAEQAKQRTAAMGKQHPGGISRVTQQRGGSRSYAWGYRFDSKSQAGRKTSKKGYLWKSGKYASMVRFSGGSGYRTFRVVSAASDPRSWIVPAEEGIPIRQATIDFVRPFVEDMIKAAVTEDLK